MITIPNELEYTPGEPQEERRRKRIERVKLYGLTSSAPRVQIIKERVEVPGPERIVHVKDEGDAAELARLREMERRMEALAARQAAPGPNIPPAIKALMDDSLSDAENVNRLRGRWAALTSQHMAEAQKSTALPPLTDAERVELATLNSWDKLRGG